MRAAFYRARASRLAESLVRAQAALADSVARLAGARLRAGDISLLEQEQAAQEAARARQTAATAREAARVDEAELARAIAWEGAPPIPMGALDAGVDQLPDTTIDLAALPAVRTAAADSAAAAAQARAAARGRVPLPTLQSGAEWGDESQPGTLGVIGIAVPFPLWNLGGGTAAEARARAARASALAGEARLDAVRQVRQARIHLEEAAARARFDRDTIVPGAAVLRGPRAAGVPGRRDRHPSRARRPAGRARRLARRPAGPARLPGGAGRLVRPHRTRRMIRRLLPAALVASPPAAAERRERRRRGGRRTRAGAGRRSARSRATPSPRRSR